MQIGMEPLVTDWAKEELKMGQIIWHIYVYCFLFIWHIYVYLCLFVCFLIHFLNRLRDIFLPD